MKKLFPLTLMFVALTAKAQSCPDDNHPHMIDLGLPSGTYWAYRRGFGQSVRPVIRETTSICLPELTSGKSSQAVYNVFGIKVADNLGNASPQASGIYIVNGKKFVVK